MKKINYSKYYQRTMCETLTSRVYCRVVFLYDSFEGCSKYLVEVLFKFTHMHKWYVFDDDDSAMKLYNDVIK